MAEDSMNEICWDYFENLPKMSYYEWKKRHSYPDEVTETLSPKSEQLSNILEQLSLSKYFPANLTIQTVLSFRDNMFEKPKVASDIPWFILRNIMSINFNFRDRILEDCIRSVCPEPSDDNVSESDDEEDDDEGRDTEPQRLHDMYPLDVLLAIFLCCDPFLKMVIAQKMFMCQLAIPIIFEDFLGSELTFSLWPVREIVSSTGESVAEHAMKSVSFIRLGGRSLKSKSKLINELLRSQSQEHSTFFHSDCPLGLNPRTISNGLVEIAWYMPSSLSDTHTDIPSDSKQTDTIKVPFTIFNLRGNAVDYDKQRDVLIHNSTVSVLLIKYDDWETESNIRVLKEIHKSEAIVILVTNLPPNEKPTAFMKRYEEKTAMDRSKTTLLSTYSIPKKRTLNASELKRELTRHVSSALEKSDRNIRLAEIYLQEGISCDEENKKCTYAKKLSDDIGALELKLSSEDSSTRKKAYLPLQGEHWQNWSRTMRKQSSSGKKEAYDVGEKLLITMKNERKKQVEQCNRSPPVFAEFIKALISIDNDATLLYFLSWLRQHMDTQSRNVVPNLLKKLHDAIEKHELQKSDKTELIVNLADQKLVQASFGIEHFFREIGQVYEAFIYTKNDTCCTIKPITLFILEQLPKVVAKLLVLGHPLEIMNGDAACVPITWIKAVFKALVEYLGDKKLYAISVLGIQSSGKSTLLNTMFGLQFVVSAGRCTRGMNIHLVHVDRTKSSLQFDYAMVIDTEGLRAPELFGEHVHRDKEFATLVVGLADVIIINIKGEAIADMKDILQIVVYGILSLKQANDKLNLQQFCVFVHENVSALNAATQMLQGTKSTVQYLDRMTKEVASHLHIGHIISFKRVIEFNPLLHVKYIPDLWYGSPPMAPASPSYSEHVTEVTKCVLRELAMTKKTAVSISDTCLHLEALWKGILTEDFVFSFSNCLELKAYSSLESVYQQLVWRLEKFKLERWINKIRPKLSKCATCQILDTSGIELMSEFTKDIGELAHEVNTELTEFFDTAELCDHMIHWKESKLGSLDLVATDIKNDVLKKIKHEKVRWTYQLRINDERSVHQNFINKKATTIAHSLKGMKAPKRVLKVMFDELWNVWLAEIVPLDAEGTQPRLKHEIQNAVLNKFRMYIPLVVKELGVTDIDSGFGANILKDSIPASEITKEHINLKIKCETEEELLHAFQKEESHCKQQTFDVVNKIFSQINTYFAELFMQDTGYEKTQFSQVLNIITEAFDGHSDLNSHNKFTMTPVLQIKVVVHAARYCFDQFKTLDQRYQNKHSLRALLEAYKPDAWQFFTDIVEAKTEEIIAANTLCRDLKGLIQERIEREIPIKIQTKMRGIYHSQKYHLIIAVLTDLAESGEFSDYERYLDNPATFVLKWITDATIRTVFEKKDTPPLYMEWVEEALLTLICDIKKDAKHVTRTERPSDIKDWVTSFRQRLENKSLLLSPDTFQNVTNHTVTDFDSFLNRVNEQLSEKQQDIHSHFDRLSSGEITWKDETPYRLLFDSLWGCTELCPWCREPCQKAAHNHVITNTYDYHTCIQHRPCALGRIVDFGTDNLSVESCNFCVQSRRAMKCSRWCNCPNPSDIHHPCREYKKYIPEWDIAPSSDMSSSQYWTWFMAKYNDQLAEHYHVRPADIPDSWKMISQEVALRSLREYVL